LTFRSSKYLDFSRNCQVWDEVQYEEWFSITEETVRGCCWFSTDQRELHWKVSYYKIFILILKLLHYVKYPECGIMAVKMLHRKLGTPSSAGCLSCFVFYSQRCEIACLNFSILIISFSFLMCLNFSDLIISFSFLMSLWWYWLLRNLGSNICIWNHFKQRCPDHRSCQIWFACGTRDWKNKAWSRWKCSWNFRPWTWKIWLRDSICSPSAWDRMWRGWRLLDIVCTWWEHWVLLYHSLALHILNSKHTYYNLDLFSVWHWLSLSWIYFFKANQSRKGMWISSKCFLLQA